MDIRAAITAFIEELLGLHGAYALTDIDDFSSAADALAMVRLRVRLCDAMINEGWQPNATAAAHLERDRVLLAELDDDSALPTATSRDEDRAALRARAIRVVADAAKTARNASNARESARELPEELAQMRRALSSRAVIEQAKGIAMERYGLRAEVAWSWLVRTSQDRNVKVRDLAHELVDSLEHPERHATTANGQPSLAKRRSDSMTSVASVR
jgi:hypothetical protein